MSSSDPQDTHDPNSLLFYAPRRLRSRAHSLWPMPVRQEKFGQTEPTTSPERRAKDEVAPLEKPFSKVLRLSGEPEPMEPKAFVRQRARRNGAFVVAICSAAVAGIVGGAALLYVMNFNGSRDQALAAKDGGTSLSATPQEKKAAVDQLIQRMTTPALAVEDRDGNINEPLPLGVKVTGHTQGETVNLSGLPADTKLTTGVSSAAGEWRVAVNDLPVTVVIPPRDYVGPMNIVAELPGDNSQPVLRRAVRLTWRQETPRPSTAERLQAPAANASPVARTATPETARQIDPKEIAGLIKRGEELASDGDVPAARLLLQRAAEAHNARAAFELAATYDPIVIKQLGNNTARPDLALARAWYQRARDWGSPDAAKQLEALASAER